MSCSDDEKQSENKQIRAAYQCPITLKYRDGSTEEEAIPYTFEDSLALANLKLFRDYENPSGLLNNLTEALGKTSLGENRENRDSDRFILFSLIRVSIKMVAVPIFLFSYFPMFLFVGKVILPKVDT